MSQDPFIPLEPLAGKSLGPAIWIREVPGKGRGVFAGEPIGEGQSIEICPVVVVAAREVSALIETNLANYYFSWGGTDEDAAIALGFGSLYNHANVPNALYVKKRSLGVIEFVSLRAIAQDEEITVSYHGGFGDQSAPWFEVV